MEYYIDECDKEPPFSCHPQNDFYFGDCSISTIQDENYYTDFTTCAKNGAVEQMQPNIQSAALIMAASALPGALATGPLRPKSRALDEYLTLGDSGLRVHAHDRTGICMACAGADSQPVMTCFIEYVPESPASSLSPDIRYSYLSLTCCSPAWTICSCQQPYFPSSEKIRLRELSDLRRNAEGFVLIMQH